MAIAPDNTLGSLGSILGAVPGLAEAIGGKTTTTSNSGISGQGLSALLQQILSSTNGLASVAGGQNTAGLYNSTVQQQSVNDLLTRSAGEVATKGPTTSVSQVAPSINLGQTLLEGAAGLIGSKALGKLGGVVSNGFDSVTSALGSSVAGSDSAAASLVGASPFTTAGSAAPAATAGLEAGSTGVGASGFGGAAAGSSAAGGVSGAAGVTGAGALDASTAAGIGAASAGLAGATGAATAGGLAAGGATLGGIGGAIAGDVAASTAGIAAGAGVGAGAAAGGAAAAGGIGDALGVLATALAWVVCTELAIQGEMDHETYRKAAPDFVARTRLKPSAVRGYHWWAVRYTRIMRRKDWIGKLAVAAIKPLANGRAKYIAGERNVLGWITFSILEPICSYLGNTVARRPQDWKKLYKGE